MPLLENDIPIIEKFLENALTNEEQSYFNDRLKDGDFIQELEAYKNAHRAIQAKGRQELKSTFSKWDQEIEGDSSAQKADESNSNTWIKYLLGILLLSGLALGVYFILNNNKQDKSAFDKNRYAAHFEAYPNIIAPLQKGAPEEDTYKKAFQLYETKDFDAARDAFTALDQADEAVQFYQAMNAMASKNYTKANVGLLKILEQKSHRFYAPAQWYAALLDIQKNKIQEAKNKLTTISKTTDHLYRAKAIALLEEL